MRLWSLHPRYLDAKGLVALWREALLAQKVLAGATRGYRHHPQLQRFREQADASGAIAVYLRAVQQEAERRGYRFDASKIGRCSGQVKIAVTRGQIEYEWRHLRAKLAVRDPAVWERNGEVMKPEAHPLFEIVDGAVAAWEVIAGLK
jgi:hypothetical protein